jgi:hypothetical protein
MCDYCGTFPHHYICPNHDDDVQIFGECSVCGQDIVEHDEIFQLSDDEAIHADCVQRFTPEEVFTVLNIDPSQTFKNSDIDGQTFLELFGIKKEVA